MSAVPVPDDLLKDLTCSSCGYLISLGPVTKTSSGYQCGRCPNENGETNFLYETLARGYLFPCKFRNSGCDAWLPFGVKAKTHEVGCERKPYICPMVPLEKCEWQGQFVEIEEHLKSIHAEFVLDELKVNVDLTGTKENRYAYFCNDRSLVLLIDLIHYEGKGLSVELMKMLTDENKNVSFEDKYEIVLHSHHNGGKITFARNLSNYVLNSNFLRVANDLLESSLLNYVGRYDNKVTVNFELPPPKATLTSHESIVDISVNNYVFYPCKNRMYGCNYMNYYRETQKHESTCITYECPLKSQKCSWQGLMDRLENHCLKHHEVAINTFVINLKEITPNGKNTFFFLLKSMTYGLFRVCIKLENYEIVDTLMHTVVQFVGEKENAKNYIFDVKLHHSCATNRKSFSCGQLTSDEDAFDLCAHFHYNRLKESVANFSIRKRN